MLSSLPAEQKTSLQAMQAFLGLAADIAHAVATIYLPAEDKKYFFVLKQEQPRTQRGSVHPDSTGRRVRAVEEPLVARALQKNMPVKGKREWQLGVFNTMEVFPLRDARGRSYAAVSFETSAPDEIIIAQSLELLCNANLGLLDNPHYRRMDASEAVLVADQNKLIIAARPAAKHLFEVMEIPQVVGRRTNDVDINWPLAGMVIETGTAEGKEFYMHGLLLSMRVLPVAPQPRGGCAIIMLQDITELRAKDEELRIKSVVIKEIHHRVKNNLQTIVSLLRLQERRVQLEETRSVLRDLERRVGSIAIVHEYLSQQDSGLIDVGKVAKGIYQALIASMLAPDFRLETHFAAAAVLLPSEKATSIALIINELLQNSIEHAFPGRTQGSLDFSFAEEGAYYTLRIADDGVGLPENFQLGKQQSLGLKIIKTMAESDLQGSFSISGGSAGGTLAVVKIPKGVRN